MVSDELLRQISDFIHHEGRLCDLSRYADWEALWTDDAHYWVPRADGLDPEELFVATCFADVGHDEHEVRALVHLVLRRQYPRRVGQ